MKTLGTYKNPCQWKSY